MQIKLCRKICIRIISCQLPSLCGALNIQLCIWSNKYISVLDIMFHVSLTQVSVLLSRFLFSVYKINKMSFLCMQINLSHKRNRIKGRKKKKTIMLKNKKIISSSMYMGENIYPKRMSKKINM